MKLVRGLTVVLALAACDGKPGAPAAVDPVAPAPGTSEVDRPHVVFTRPELVLDRVGVAVAPPVTTPSQPSQLTLASDDPSIVAVDSQGMLVGMRAGSTQVRATGGGSVLRVSVVEVSGLRFTPERVALEPGREARIEVRDQEGRVVPHEAVRWSFPAGTPIAVVGDRVISMGPAGQFELQAEVGGAHGALPVAVTLPGSARLVVNPPRARMRRGEVSAFRLQGAAGDVRSEWTSTDPGVLAGMGGGLFQAVKVGRARACASAVDRVTCSDVEVSP